MDRSNHSRDSVGRRRRGGTLPTHREDDDGPGVSAAMPPSSTDRKHEDLQELENRLWDEVDEDFFEDPKTFRTLHRVIDVLGAQIMDDRGGVGGAGASDGPGGFGRDRNNFENLHKNNPAYLALRRQQKVVEDAIEHMAVAHCADLNSSVVAVGRVSRQFSDAVGKVRSLRRQVREVKESLGSGGAGGEGGANPNEAAMNGGADMVGARGGRALGTGANAAAAGGPGTVQPSGKSLRELWLKKLECEAVLTLLGKLEVIRDAPTRFDVLVTPRASGGPCRIGAAVAVLSDAISTMFSDDVAQVQALHKIMEQLMARKQKSEEMIWDTLHDVIYLRTGNAPAAGPGGGEDDDNDKGKGKGDKKGGGGGSAGGGGPGTGGASSSAGSQEKGKKRRQSFAVTGGPVGGAGGNGGGASGTPGGGAAGATPGGGPKGPQNPFLRGRDLRRTTGLVGADHDDDGCDSDSGSECLSDDASVASTSNQEAENVRMAALAASSAAAVGTKGGAAKFRASVMAAKGGGGAASGGSVVGPKGKGKGLKSILGAALLGAATRMMIPRHVLEQRINVEADELRCLDHSPPEVQIVPTSTDRPRSGGVELPRYADPILALRILAECLAKLQRLDDVERYLNESLEREVRRLAEREQARTFARLERRRARARGTAVRHTRRHRRSSGGYRGQEDEDEGLRDFRRHLSGLLSSFGTVMLRLSHLAQILRHRLSTDPNLVTHAYATKSSAMHSVLVAAYTHMNREIKKFLQACLDESEDGGGGGPPAPSGGSVSGASVGSRRDKRASQQRSSAAAAASRSVSSHERGLFSLGIATTDGPSSGPLGRRGGDRGSDPAGFLASRSAAAALPPGRFVSAVLLPRTNTSPEVRHALTFRRSLARWTSECANLKRELSLVTGEDTTSPTYNATTEETAMEYLDALIQTSLLPVLQNDAVDGTVSALERVDAFEPVPDAAIYAPGGGAAGEVEMCPACAALHRSTGPLFAALHRLPRGGEMYSPLVAVLEHTILTFNSRVKQRVGTICGGKTAFWLLEGGVGGGGGDKGKSKTAFGAAIEGRRAFALLLRSYDETDAGFDQDEPDARSLAAAGAGALQPLAPSPGDTKVRHPGGGPGGGDGVPGAGDLEGIPETDSRDVLESELKHLQPLLDFTNESYGSNLEVCDDQDLMRAASLAHGLLRVSGLLEARLKSRNGGGGGPGPTRQLYEAIKTIHLHGLRMAKFCRVDMLIQTVKRMSKICKSATLVAKDAVRLPSCVNDLGEYLTTASDNLRESGGNAIAAYALSSLEQYIPLFLMQTVRIIAAGKGLPSNASITLNGIEALDRSGSVLYRDLKGATSFENSFWDDEAAADSFERSASYVAMMELDMEELESYCRNNRNEFSDEDYMLMFAMDGPRRAGDIGRYELLKDRMRG